LVIANMTDSEALRRHHLADYLHSSAGSVGVSTTSGGASKLLEGGHRYIVLLVVGAFLVAIVSV